MILVIDNVDSFVFNLARHVEMLGRETRVVRNDAVTIDAIMALAPEAIVISPGPCGPYEAGISMAVVQRLGATVPILGVCLGHQCIGAAFGARVGRARRPMHGKAAPLRHDGRDLFHGLPDPFMVGRYHSLIVEDARLPACLAVTARSDEGEIMALAHRARPIRGVQFHPESILTEHGCALLGNFLALVDRWRA